MCLFGNEMAVARGGIHNFDLHCIMFSTKENNNI